MRVFEKPLIVLKKKRVHWPLIIVLIAFIFGFHLIYFCKEGGWVAAGGMQIYVKPEPDSICCKLLVCKEKLKKTERFL
jgi:hypothetical protein